LPLGNLKKIFKKMRLLQIFFREAVKSCRKVTKAELKKEGECRPVTDVKGSGDPGQKCKHHLAGHG
jgi:hypothetical protein